MKFVVDAQLPARLAEYLTSVGHKAVHTSELPEGNRTVDDRIAELADAEDRVVLALVEENLDTIVSMLDEADFVELSTESLVVHRRH